MGHQVSRSVFDISTTQVKRLRYRAYLSFNLFHSGDLGGWEVFQEREI